MRSQYRQARRAILGVTLVEVLIAATILFSFLVIASESYRTFLTANAAATGEGKILEALPVAMSSIKSSLALSQEAVVSGVGSAYGVAYKFSAKAVLVGSPPRRFDPDVLEFTSYPPRFRLYEVTVELAINRQVRRFVYKEFTWS